jgi:hypothetical protein
LFCATPSFLSGLARTLDIAGQFDEYNDELMSPAVAPEAIARAWRDVGDMLFGAMQAVADEAARSQPSE